MNREIKTLMDAAEICGERHNQAAEDVNYHPCVGCPLRGVTCAEITAGKPGATAMIQRFWVVDTLRKAAEAQMSMFVQTAEREPPFEEIARAWAVTRGGSLRKRIHRRREKADRRGPWLAPSHEPFHTYTLFNMRVRVYFFRLGKGGI